MLVVFNLSTPKIVYSRTISNVVPGSKYYASAYITNIMANGFVPANVTLRVRDAANKIIGQINTGNLVVGLYKWNKYGFDVYPNTSSIVIEVLSNSASNNGNGEDFALDDISLG
jgi:hypothetical protein